MSKYRDGEGGWTFKFFINPNQAKSCKCKKDNLFWEITRENLTVQKWYDTFLY
jgi:hypothetical protein